MNRGAEELRKRRNAAGISQQDLAVKVGLHLASISQYERGLQHPRHEVAQQLDDELAAGGAVLTAFGYAAATDYVTRGEFDRFVAVVEALGRAVGVPIDGLIRRLEAMERGDAHEPGPATRADERGPEDDRPAL